jgi:uncharacterized membrane protein YphA (DoxX/SURF4 family)
MASAGALGGRGGSTGGASAYALRILALMLGAFFVFNGIDKLSWFLDSSILAGRLDGWLASAAPASRWYLETVAMPGIPLFARVVPIAELAAGAALIVGFWTRLAAFMALAMVANFHLARGLFFSGEFLTDGVGFPVLGALLALAIAGVRLPWSVSR